jgi:glycosyltransferase involved in cell wall biosynthesis
MRIFVVAHNCRRGGGVSVAQNLIRAFARVAPEHEYCFTIPPDLGYEECCRLAPRNRQIIYRHRDLARRWMWDTWQLPSLLRAFVPDVIFNMANQGFMRPPVPQATLVQDPHLYYPSKHYGRVSARELAIARYHRWHFARSLRRTHLVFCQTESARTRLRAAYGTGVRIELCPNQGSTSVGNSGSLRACPQAVAHLGKALKLLVVSRYYEHKNLEIIPTVFAQYREQLRDVALVLTLSSGEHPRAARLLRDIEHRGLSSNIITVGPVPQDELGSYYAHTDALFMPTLLESFSGTYVEAMRLGRPILTSDLDFAREVCGDAALYFDPFDPKSICDSIVRFKDNLATRERLIEAGIRRSADSVSWDQIGRRVTHELEALRRQR